MIKEWQDQRSGAMGCMAGNYVLQKIQQPREDLVHLKGTVFVSKSRLIIGRICCDSYLSGDWLHFCNLTKQHHRRMNKEAEGRKIQYLFITISRNEIHYWLIPHRVISRILARAKVKPSDSASILRIKNENGRHLMLGRDVTDFYHCLIMHPGTMRKVQKLGYLLPTG